MNTLLFVLVSLALALVLGLLAVDDPGYVLLSREPWEIEVSLALFLLLLLLLFTGLYLLVRMLIRTLTARRDLQRWRRGRDRDRAARDIMQGYARLIEGDWAEAERELSQRLEHSELPLLNHLGAAYAAQQKGDYVSRDAWLDAAATQERRFRDPVELTRARLQYQAGQLADARRTLEALPASVRKRAVVERMEAEVLRSLGDRRALAGKLSKYRRHHAFSDAEYAELEGEVYGRRYLEDAAAAGGSAELARAWTSIPEKHRRDAAVIADYVRQLAAAGETERAADQIRSALHHQWEASLVPLFGTLEAIDLAERIRQCQVWREKHPEDPLLLHTLARLERVAGEREEAQQLFAAAIRHGAPAEAYLELGEMLERAGESAEAMTCYRRGLEVGRSRGTLRALPKATPE